MVRHVAELTLLPTPSSESGSIDMLMTVLGQRYVQYYPVLAELSGSAKAALMLGHMLYWSRRYLAARSVREGWFWHTRRDWHAATGLSRDEQERARRCLRGAGLISERLMGVPARMHYRIELDVLGTKIAKLLRKQYAGWRWDDAFVRGLLGRNVAFLRGLADVSGSIHAALYLSELCALSRRTRSDREKNRDGWLDAPIGEAATRLCLSEKSLRHARSFLRERQLIRECSSGGVQPRTLTFIELPTIAERVIRSRQRTLIPVAGANSLPNDTADFSAKRPLGTESKGMAENAIPDLPKPANWNGGNVQSRGAQTRQLDWRKRAIQTCPNPPTGPAQTPPLDQPKPANKLAGNVRSINGVLSTQNLKPQQTPATSAQALTAALPANAASGGCGLEIIPQDQANAGAAPLQLDRPLPAGLTEEEAAQAITLIQRLADAQQQPVLDEWIGQIRIPGKITSRMGYLFALVRSARQNEFVALIGLQVAKERAYRHQVQEAVARSRTTVKASLVATAAHERHGEPSAAVGDARQAIQDIRRKLR